ncbi:MAG TPA: bifunctional aspartate kinase/homoserine dehydrogenase I [Polyangia bacterium]|nr:bifunctional aspartate kinase/homoserine dehydrogenase I [Polyangia bacterium]
MAGKKAAPEVHKFGGASLGDAEAFRHAVGIMQKRTAPRAIVVSALAGITDALLGLANRATAGGDAHLGRDAETLRTRYRAILDAVCPAGEAAHAQIGKVIDQSTEELLGLLQSLTFLRELTARTSDLVVSRGERLSAQLFVAALAGSGVKARYVDALEVVFTNGPYGGASPNLALTDAAARRVLRPLIDGGVVPVVPGFLGAAPRDEEDGAAAKGRPPGVATLGRGGSDLTATLLGRALGAAQVSLWKDVPGLLTADPRVVSNARVIPQLHVREAAELAYFGAKVLHPRALIPIVGKSIPVYVRPFADPRAAGTEISARRTLDKYPVKALSAASGQALLTVTGSGMQGVPGIAARTFEALFRIGVSVALISQSSSEQSICLGVPETAARKARERLLEVFREEIARQDIDGVEVRTGLATLAVVGIGMAGHRGIAARVFGALAAAGINIVAIAQGSSELNISFVVDAKDAGAAQRAIHDAFQLSKIGGGGAERADHTDVVLLGFGQIGRSLATIIAKRKNGAGKVRVVAALDRSGFVFDPKGISPRAVGALSTWKKDGKSFADAPAGRPAAPEDAVTFLARHALADPVLVDVTADETGPLVKLALGAGMDVVMANKRPLSGSRKERDELEALAKLHGRRVLFEATVGAGLPILDTYRKLDESGDRVLKIEGCLSGTLGFLLTEIGRGRPFSQALRKAMEKGFTEPDPRDDLSGADVGRKALILGRLLGFPGEPADVVVESLVPEKFRALALKDFLASLEKLDAEWERRAADARAKGMQLRYIASVTKSKIAVGLATVDGKSPFHALKGTANQIAFTTTRYRDNPLVITGPGAGPAVTAAGVLNDILGLRG